MDTALGEDPVPEFGSRLAIRDRSKPRNSVTKACYASILLFISSATFTYVANAAPRSILVLEQSDVRGPFYAEIFSAFRQEINASDKPTSLYVENLDLSRFGGPEYERGLLDLFAIKYHDKPIGVIVTVGSRALSFALRWRSRVWANTPLVFAFVDETEVGKLRLPSGVTGSTTRLRLQDMVDVAHLIVPALRQVAILGDKFETQPAFRHFLEEIRDVSPELKVLDLTGLPMAELLSRVSNLPEGTAILYTAIYSNGAGTYFPPADSVAMVAKAANRPIIAPIETYIGRGVVGGLVTVPSIVGVVSAKQALQILDGQSPSNIPIVPAMSFRPEFDWRQLQKWNVDERRLPANSEIRYRRPSIWAEYPAISAAIAAVLLLQTGLIAALLIEHRRRRQAEIVALTRMNDLARMNRRAAANELSSSIAHEINSPLGAVLANTEAAQLLLKSSSPDLSEIGAILVDIRRSAKRASDVILRLRRLLRNADVEMEEVDVNQMLHEVFQFVMGQACANGIELKESLTEGQIRVRGDPIQLQQVILNLVMNGMEAVRDRNKGPRRIVGSASLVDDAFAEISISDNGLGIPTDKLNQVFEPFYTTKKHGIGMGLAIARTIVEAHGGSIRAEIQNGAGSVFRVRFPLVTASRGGSNEATHLHH